MCCFVAIQAGLDEGFELSDRSRLTPDAAHYAEKFIDAGGSCQAFSKLPRDCDVIVDAILGTGLNSDVRGGWADAIAQINRHAADVLSLDIPSGLHADTGSVLGVAIKARLTTSFIGLKQGMFTGKARDYCGDISFHALDIPARIYSSEIHSCRRFDWQKLKKLVSPRQRCALEILDMFLL